MRLTPCLMMLGYVTGQPVCSDSLDSLTHKVCQTTMWPYSGNIKRAQSFGDTAKQTRVTKFY